MSIARGRFAGGSYKDRASPRLRLMDNSAEFGGGEPGEIISLLDAPPVKLQRVFQTKPFQLHQVQEAPLVRAQN